MPEFKLTRKKAAEPPAEITPEQESSLLPTLAMAPLSGLHTLGSVLSWPSRLIHGTINAATGGEGGFGKNILNPFDSTGGIEGSAHATRLGILPQNNPKEWEWRDLGQGVADLALDPTTYIGVGALTKVGGAAAKAGKLSTSLTKQIARGERSLLGAGIPLLAPRAISVGTGKAAARALYKLDKATGASKVAKAVAQSAPARIARGMFDYTVQGLTHPTLQAVVPKSVKNLFGANKKTQAEVIRAGEALKAAGVDDDALRMTLEGVQPRFRGKYARNVPTAPVDEKHVFMHISPQKAAAELSKRGMLPQSAGALDDIFTNAGEIKAPILHLTSNGLQGGGSAYNKATKAAKMQLKSEMQAMRAHPAPVPHPETGVIDPMDAAMYEAVQSRLKSLGRKKNRQQVLSDYRTQILQDYAQQHGADEGLRTLAEVAAKGEPGMGVMVPKSQRDEFIRRFGITDAGVAKPLVDSVHVGNLTQHVAESLARQQGAGVGTQGALTDVHQYFPRGKTITADTAGSTGARSGKVLPARSADDVGRKTGLKGSLEGTVGMNRLLGDAELHDAITAAKGDWKAALPLAEEKYGHLIQRLGQTPKHRAAVASAERSLAGNTAKLKETLEKQKVAQEALDDLRSIDVNALDDMAKALHQVEVNKAARVLGRTNKSAERLAGAVEAGKTTLDNAKVAGIDRLRYALKYMAKNPEMKGTKLFGNSPIVDFKTRVFSDNKKVEMAPAVYHTISKHLNEGDGAVKLGDFLKNGGFSVRKAAEKINGKPFADAAEAKAFLNSTLDTNLVEQLNSLNPKFTKPQAVTEAQNAARNFMSWWKALTLAFPSSRIRDAVSGTVQNILHGWTDPRFLASDTNKLMSGKTITRSYEHVPEIQEWLAKSGLQWSPENQTEALRQLVALHFPSQHGILGDIPVGQAGATLKQATGDIPGREQTSFVRQFVTDPLKTMAGMGDNGATWLGQVEPGASLLDRAKAAAAQPFTGVRGVGNAAESTFAPVRASELVSGASDAYNRAGPFLQQIHGGTAADVAADAVNRAQVLYDPATFTATERAIKNNVAPFYCVPVDHEILTRDGWKFYDELTIGEEVMAYDLATEGLHWTPLQAVNTFDFDGELNKYGQYGRGRKVSFLFTDDHRWPTLVPGRMIPSTKAARRSGGTVTKIWNQGTKRFCLGKDLGGHHQLPHTGIYNQDDNEESILTPRLAKILGWVVTDGYHRIRKSKKKHSRAKGSMEMIVYQSPNKHLQDIIELLGTTPRKPHSDTGVVAVPVAREDINELAKVFSHKTDLPRIVSRLSPEAAEEMWQVMMDAEGSDNGVNTPHFAQTGPSNWPVRDAFQILCLMTGRSANISRRGCYVKKSKAYWVHDALSKEYYRGKIWCPTTAYGTWVMRHEGALVFTGNSFASRMIPETARQLSDFGSPTSQLVKTMNRAQGTDASVPDYVMAGTSIPLGQADDGTKRFLSASGLMHEDAVSKLGLLAAIASGNPGAARALGYDTLSMLNPALGVPLQRITGQSFYQRGTPLQDLDPTTGRLISNVGESLGLRDEKAGPVRYPGSTAVDAILGATPFGRAAIQARTLADPRKDIGSKLVDTLTGARITDVSASKQLSTLQRRAEDLARSEGAFESRMVGFPREQIEQLKQTNPELAARHQELQNLITSIKRRKSLQQKGKSEGGKVSRRKLKRRKTTVA